MLSEKIIDFSELINKSTEGFTGRQWVRDAVIDFIESKSSRYFLLLGEPGSGKTAFMASLINEKGFPPHHFIGKGSLEEIETSFDWCDPVRFAESVGYQLVYNYGGWVMNWEDWGILVEQDVKELNGQMTGAHVKEFTVSPRPSDKPKLSIKEKVELLGPLARIIGVYIEEIQMDPEPIVRQLLMTPLSKVAKRYPDYQVVIIVDGLDEAAEYSNTERDILKMLPDSALPNNVRFLLSSRPGEHLDTTDLMGKAQVFWLSEDIEGNRDPRTIEDAYDYTMNLAGEQAIGQMLKEKEIKPDYLGRKVADASQGNFLYLYHYAEGLRKGHESLFDLSNLPIGLFSIYGHFVKHMKKKCKDISWPHAYKPVLGVLAVTREPLYLKQIADFSTVDLEEVAEILIRIKQFLDIMGPQVKERRYKIYHNSFAEFLVSEDNEDLIDVRQAHSRISDALFKQQQMDRYKMSNLLYHLIEGQRWDDIQHVIADIEYLQQRREPEQQWAFQKEFEKLVQSHDITLNSLTLILRTVLKTVITQLEDEKSKTDWLDTFAYWMIRFGSEAPADRHTSLKKLAREFDSECGLISAKLSSQYEKKAEYQWAMRFAELTTWVNQRSDNYEQCIEGCAHAEKLCNKATDNKEYRHILEAEFIRMRARALSRYAAEQKDEKARQSVGFQADEAYEKLRDVFSIGGQNKWVPSDEEWKILEDYDSKILLPTPSSSLPDERSKFMAQVVSNKHDAISAMYIIQFMEGIGGKIRWINSSDFQLKDFAPHDTRYTVLVGGPKAPGVSLVADKFYEENKEGFLRLYSASEYVSTVIAIQEGNTSCYMIGGPSKANTLHAAWELTEKIKQLS